MAVAASLVALSPARTAQEVTTYIEGFISDGRPIVEGDAASLVIPNDLERVAGARVRIPALGLETQSDEAGTFRFEGVPTTSPYRKYQIEVTAAGFGNWRLIDAAARPQGAEVYVELTAEPQTHRYMPAEEDSEEADLDPVEPSPTATPVPTSTPTPTPDDPPATSTATVSSPADVLAAVELNDIEFASHVSGSSCSSIYSSDDLPPPTIRVWRESQNEEFARTYDFDFYVKHVLSGEWFPTWPMESLRAGAVAVTNFGWHWTNHTRNPLPELHSGDCYDVSDTTRFQVFDPTMSFPRTDEAINRNRPWVTWRWNEIFETPYRAGTQGMACGSLNNNGERMQQWGTKTCAEQGLNWRQIVREYYFPGVSFLYVPPLGSMQGADFNNDGYRDLAIGVPGEDIGGGAGDASDAGDDAGVVNVVYGGPNGLHSGGSQLIRQGLDGVAGGAEAGDRFGFAVTASLFNDDAYADLAVGVPGESVGSVPGAGAVHVLYGSASGLTAAGDQLITQTNPERGDRFGHSVAAGDFDSDGRWDLALGVPGEDVGSQIDAGLVHVLYGSSSGLTSSGGQTWHQDQPGIGGVVEARDLFGWSLTASDFGKGAQRDLAVGVPGEAVGSLWNAGAVNVIYGSSSSGLDPAGNQLWIQDSSGIGGASEKRDLFGASLAPGDFNADGTSDIAIGVPAEGVGSKGHAGAVNVIYGTANGLTSAGNQLWTGDSGVPGAAQTLDAFGWALRAANFGGGAPTDLAVGLPGQRITSEHLEAGQVIVIFGTTGGLRVSGSRQFTQQTPGVPGSPEAGDAFGSALAVGSFDGLRADLAIGVTFEGLEARDAQAAGAVNVIYTDGSNFTLDGPQLWIQDQANQVGEVAEAGDFFG